DHHIVEMLAANAAVIHDHDVAGLEAFKTEALDTVFHRGSEIGQDALHPAAILRDHASFRIQQPAAIIAQLVDHHVVGGFRQNIGHFVGISDNSVAHDLDGN